MRPLSLIGIVLMLGAFAMLGVFVILPAAVPLESSPLLKGVLQSVLCHPGDALTASTSEYDTPTSSTRSTALSCQTGDQQSYSVSGKGILIGMVGFMVPFLGGLALWSSGAAQKKRAAQQMPTRYRADHKPLAEHLAELKAALDAGLITEDEYAAKRKDILNEL